MSSTELVVWCRMFVYIHINTQTAAYIGSIFPLDKIGLIILFFICGIANHVGISHSDCNNLF
jgi:hypothetical protein